MNRSAVTSSGPTFATSVAFALAFAACGDDGSTKKDTSTPDTVGETGLDGSDVALDATPDAEPDESTVVTPLPPFQGSSPADGALNVPVTASVFLTFDGDVSDEMLTHIGLTCSIGPGVAVHTETLGGGSVVVNPIGELTPTAKCRVAWPGGAGVHAEFSFTVAAAGAAATLVYDRRDLSIIPPLPDDSLIATDPATATGRHVKIPEPARPDDVKTIFAAISAVPSTLDGWSPLAPIVVQLPASAERTTIPLTETASLDPLASVGLFDIDPVSPTYRQRLAFDLIIKDEKNVDGTPAHTWVVFPTAPLEPRGHYAFVITRHALVDETQPLGASAYMTEMLGKEHSPAGEALASLSGAKPTLYADDVALLLSISVRSDDGVPSDLLAIRAGLLAAAPPTYTITDVEPETDPESPVAVIVTGTWESVSYRDGDALARDTNGKPKQNGMTSIPFTLAVPKAAADGPVPIIIYEHGNPGSAESEVPHTARALGLAEAGFAVIGFTNIDNREIIKGSGDVSAANNAVFLSLLQKHRFPATIALLDNAEQLAFLRLIAAMSDLDVLPAGAPDGHPDLDVTAPLGYYGVSHGSFQGTGLLPFAPEIHAAALIVGGGRWTASIVHQEDAGPMPQHLYEVVTGVFPSVTRAEFWAGISLSQMGVDDQDWLMNARRLYRHPLELETPARASLLMFEGVTDSLVPVYSTRAAAAAFGIPQLDPMADPVPFLAHVTGPVSGNIDASTTAAMAQFVPHGVTGIAETPGCADQTEGHFCPQGAAEAVKMRVAFFKSALAGVPRIDPE